MRRSDAEGAPPPPTDLEGWRRAIGDGHFKSFKKEAIVTALQELGPNADPSVINPLMLYISDAILQILRKHVGTNHRNRGEDIVEDAHDRLVSALLQPSSADGKGLRTAFVPRVRFRAADAIRMATNLYQREQLTGNLADLSDAQSARTSDPQTEWNESLDVEDALSKITDPRKRLAFQLHMEGIPLTSTRTHSIEAALGVDAKTVGNWIEEVRTQLTPIVGERI